MIDRMNWPELTDSQRLLWLFKESSIDQLGDIDIHEHACLLAGGIEPTDKHYLRTIRFAIDKAAASAPAERGD